MALWDIDDNPELAIKGRFVRDENGDEVWVLVAKRAWQKMGSVWVEQAKPEIHDTPFYAGKDGFSALKHDHEFHGVKKNTDVIVHGKARTYAKRPLHHHTCRLLVEGHVDKTICVSGPRRWVEHAGTVTPSIPQPFIERDIDYSFAIGADERNRLGCGVAKTNTELLKQNVPAIFYPKEEWTPNNKKTRVAGFGALPPFFSARLIFAGTFDKQWELTRKPLLPEDFDCHFFQSAPLDQQCKGYLSGNELISLSGFSHGDVLSFHVPSEHYLACVHIGEVVYQAPMHIYTVYVDTDSQCLSISYCASFPCQGQEHLLTKSTISVV